MRRAPALVAVGAAGWLLAGCALPAGIDGDLTSGWAAMPETEVFTPRSGVCHGDGYQSSSSVAAYQPIDCRLPHLRETVHVGEFTGSAADRNTPPREGSSQWRRAYRQCDRAAEEYLGANFRHARLWLGVTVPRPEAWESGARWYGCEVLLLDEETLVERGRAGSLAGALIDEPELRLGCFEASVDDSGVVDTMTPIGCDQTHQAEYVGLWEAPDGDYLDSAVDTQSDLVYQGCREQVAAYVGVPVDADLAFRTGAIADWMEPEDWANGDRKFRCYLWLNGEDLTGSLEGQGVDALPVR